MAERTFPAKSSSPRETKRWYRDAVSTGAGAASRHSIGTGVIGGMLAATFIAVLFIPLFFVWSDKVGVWLRGLGRKQEPEAVVPPTVDL